MKAFHNDKGIKRKYLGRVIAHEKADEIIKGRYWEMGSGCAVGCTIHSQDHSAYEHELGIPEWLAQVEDVLFEGMPLKNAKKWPRQFLKAINVGANLDEIRIPFTIFILESSLKYIKSVKYDKKVFPKLKSAQKRCENAIKKNIQCHKLGLSLRGPTSMGRPLGSVVYDTGCSIANSVKSLEGYLAYAATQSICWAVPIRRSQDVYRLANSIDAIVYSAYWAANSNNPTTYLEATAVEYSSVYTARSAMYAAYSSTSRTSVASTTTHLKFSRELLRLLRNCKPKKEKK